MTCRNRLRRGTARSAFSALVALTVFALPGTAQAALSISVPGNASLGSSAAGGGPLTAQLGTVTVNASGIVLPNFVATVSTTTFTTGGGTANETIAKSRVSYWSGPVTASTGLQTATPGQLTSLLAVDLSTSRTAFGSVGLVLSISTSWNPTLIVTPQSSAVAGAYTGTITHSVA